ncbi:MAG: VWA domain-containing protein [Blastocatellia bacterium]|nr:MAG: VWA domain-containing protein [Blastocatellia bacterium]
MAARLKRRAFLGSLVALSLGIVTSAQPPQAPPTFRATTRLIVETVVVKDREGRAVEGLSANDFVITEDGERQEIAFIEFQRLQGAAGQQSVASVLQAEPAAGTRTSSETTVMPTTQTQIAIPPPGRIRYQNRRLLVFYFDLSAMPPADQVRASVNAQKFVDTDMAAADLIAIMTFERGAVRVKQDFTDDRERLREVIQALIYGDDQNGDGIPDAPEEGSAFGQDEAEFNIFNTDRQLSALQTAVTMLRPLPEQKSLIYFASTLRLNGADNQAQFRATVNAAIRSNVIINPIDARGLVATPPLGDATQPSAGGIDIFSGQVAGRAMTNFQRSQDTLYALGKDTGGKAMFDYNDLALGIAQAAKALTSYYIIGYYSNHTVNDGRFRRVHVTLRGNVSADLQYRQGYFAEKAFGRSTAADKERQLEEALMLENPITDITIAMEVNYFQLNRAEYFVPVAIKIPGRELALARRRGAQRTVIDLIGEVKEDNGFTVQNVRDKLDIKLSDENATQLARRPIQYETGFTLLPGKYAIKVLARDAETGRVGTYQTAFTVPNLNREEKRVPISSVVLSSQRVAITDALYNVKNSGTPPAVNPLVFGGEKLIPSVTRVFSRSRELHVFLQAYQRGASETQPLIAFVGFYRNQVRAFETPPLAVTDGLDAKSKAVPLRFALSIAELPPGQYDCQVTVLDPTHQRAAFWHAPIVLIP